MTNRELNTIIQKIMKEKVLDLTELAKELEVNRSHLSTIINDQTTYELKRSSVLKKVRKSYPSYFPLETKGNENQHQNQQEDKISYRQYALKVEKHNASLQRLLETNLTALATTQHLILSQIQAGQKYTARRDSKGDKKKEDSILNEINTFSAEYFGGVTKGGNGHQSAGSHSKDQNRT